MFLNFKVFIFVINLKYKVMRYDKDKNDVLNIRLSISLKEQYLRFIKDNGYSLSRRIRILLENDMKNGK